MRHETEARALLAIDAWIASFDDEGRADILYRLGAYGLVLEWARKIARWVRLEPASDALFRYDGDRVRAECPICESAGAFGWGYLPGIGLEMHLSRGCPGVRDIADELWQKWEVAPAEARAEAEAAAELAGLPPGDVGFIYLISDGEALKIGLTRTAPAARLTQLQTAHSRPLSLVAAFKSEQVKTAESYLHEKFRAHRIRREWFADVSEIRAEFERIAGEAA